MAQGRTAGQSGVSLIESLLVLVLTASVILVIAVGMQTVVETDGQTNRIQRGGLALTTVTEALRSTDVPFLVCPVSPSRTIEETYQAAIADRLTTVDKVAVPTFRVVQVDYWIPPTWTPPSQTPEDGRFVTTSTTTTVLAPGDPGTAGQCVPDTPAGEPPTLLRVRIAVTTGKETLYGEAVKRKPLDGEAKADSGGT